MSRFLSIAFIVLLGSIPLAAAILLAIDAQKNP